jgi:hypothetical protein
MMVPSGVTDHVKRVPGPKFESARISAGTQVRPRESMMDLATVFTLDQVNAMLAGSSQMVNQIAAGYPLLWNEVGR